MSQPSPVDPDRTRPVTFARVFWHFALGGLGASAVGLILVPRVLARWELSDASITSWSLYLWLTLLVLAFAPLVRALVREWSAPP